MNYPGMPVIIQAPNQTLTIPFDQITYTFNKGCITGLYFGQAEPMVTSMIDEMNGQTKIFGSRIKSMICWTMGCFFCFPCISCIMMCKMIQIQSEFQEKVQEIVNKNKQMLESLGFSCSFRSVDNISSDRRQRANRTYHLEFQKYLQNQSGMGMPQNNGYPPNYAPNQQQNPQNYQQPNNFN